MSAYNTTLLDEDDNEIYPKTLAENVYDGNVRMDQKVDGIRTDLGNPSSASAVTGADAFSKISKLNSDLASKKYNKISAQVTLTDLYTDAQPYTFPNDGYLRLSVSATGTVYYKLLGASGSTQNVPEMTITSAQGRVLLFVRAGMRWGISGGDNITCTAIYAPLNYA